jgi:hypothetical protein
MGMTHDSSGSGRSMVAERVFRRYFVLLAVLWVVLVLYPNPVKFVISIQRMASFDVDAGAIEVILGELPSDPVAVEQAVLARIPYGYDWQVYGMPWYVPSVEEVLQQGRGDCKARAFVLASVFEAQGTPYLLNISPMHVWVEYEGKKETAIEKDEQKFYQRNLETGETEVQLPRIPVSQVAEAARAGFWTAMPADRKVLLVSGLTALIAARLAILVLDRRRRAPISSV